MKSANLWSCLLIVMPWLDLWYAAGCFWTWHSWDGCEGINDRAYRAPGEAYLRPMVRTFRVLEIRDWVSKGLGQEGKLALPSFTGDLAVRIERTQPVKRTTVPGTQ